jgi:3-hydroxymyristoyl/3-hydroxydecanoyl-(acyl carrier protein) dehydratase
MTMQSSIAAARIGNPQNTTDGLAIFEFCFRANAPVFAGHFPNRPLLPGIFQLEMARAAAENILNCPLAVREISKAKFQRPILPDEIVRLELKLSETEKIIQARVSFSVKGQAAAETILLLWRNQD